MNQSSHPDSSAFPGPDAKHPAGGVVALSAALRELGHDPLPVLQHSGLPARASDDLRQVPVAQELVFIRESLRVSGRPDLGLVTGSRHRIPDFWVLALAASPNIGSAIRIGLQYFDLANAFLEWKLAQVGDEANLVMHPAFPLGELEPFVVERDAVALAAMLRGLTGSENGIAEACFAYPQPAWAERYEDALRCEIRFDCDRHALQVPVSALEQPLPHGSIVAAAAAQMQRGQLLGTLRPAGTLVTQLRRFLLTRPGRLPDQDDAARHLGLSRRTLRRRLAEEGAGFRAIVDEIRCALVTGYLEHTAISLDEIAARSGFSDAANLSHAFRRWTGGAPGAWRRRHRSATS